MSSFYVRLILRLALKPDIRMISNIIPIRLLPCLFVSPGAAGLSLRTCLSPGVYKKLGVNKLPTTFFPFKTCHRLHHDHHDHGPERDTTRAAERDPCNTREAPHWSSSLSHKPEFEKPKARIDERASCTRHLFNEQRRKLQLNMGFQRYCVLVQLTSLFGQNLFRQKRIWCW